MNCPTGKKRHPSRTSACRFRRAYSNGRRLRPYFCDRCKGWHLTTRAVNAFFEGKEA